MQSMDTKIRKLWTGNTISLSGETRGSKTRRDATPTGRRDRTSYSCKLRATTYDEGALGRWHPFIWRFRLRRLGFRARAAFPFSVSTMHVPYRTTLHGPCVQYMRQCRHGTSSQLLQYSTESTVTAQQTGYSPCYSLDCRHWPATRTIHQESVECRMVREQRSWGKAMN